VVQLLYGLLFLPDAEHLSVVDKSAFADVLGEAAWWYACYCIRDMSAKVGTKTSTSFFCCNASSTAQRFSFSNQAIMATDSSKLRWVAIGC